jgi:hypothetical protein
MMLDRILQHMLCISLQVIIYNIFYSATSSFWLYPISFHFHPEQYRVPSCVQLHMSLFYFDFLFNAEFFDPTFM